MLSDHTRANPSHYVGRYRKLGRSPRIILSITLQLLELLPVNQMVNRLAMIIQHILSICVLVLVVRGQNLAQLMTIQPGTTNGGCGARTTLLTQYAQETLQSIEAAINAINTHGGQTTQDGNRVGRALNAFFKISPTARTARSERNKIVGMYRELMKWIREI